ncbi:hypothetical protein HNR34_001190 [Geobacillus subterraneus]
MNVQVKEVYHTSYLNIISALFKKLGLPQLIDHLFPVDPQCQTRVSDAVQAIIYNLFDGRQDLVHLERWAQEIDLAKLIRLGLNPSWLNDDALARHLDRLYEADIHKVISTCLIHLYRKERLSLRVFHADTTDKTVYGAYESASPEVLQITHGCNRHHLWQKQIGFGLIGNEDGIPFYNDVHDGNVLDKTWNSEVLSRVHHQLKQARIEDEWIYVDNERDPGADESRQRLFDHERPFVTPDRETGIGRGGCHRHHVERSLLRWPRETAPRIGYGKRPGRMKATQFG